MEKWCNNILKKENLENWTLLISPTGGLCQHNAKRIICLPNDKALFLHEVAHAIRGIIKEDPTGHDSQWADIYTELVRKYLIQ